jgi:hypothetical protein
MIIGGVLAQCLYYLYMYFRFRKPAYSRTHFAVSIQSNLFFRFAHSLSPHPIYLHHQLLKSRVSPTCPSIIPYLSSSELQVKKSPFAFSLGRRGVGLAGGDQPAGPGGGELEDSVELVASTESEDCIRLGTDELDIRSGVYSKPGSSSSPQTSSSSSEYVTPWISIISTSFSSSRLRTSSCNISLSFRASSYAFLRF